MARKSKKTRRYGSAASRTKVAAAVAGPGGGGGTMFKNIPPETKYYTPEEGKVVLRFLPYVVSDPKHPDGAAAPADDIWYKRPFKRFRNIGAEKKPFISPRSVGKPCPVLEYYQVAKADPTISDKEANKAKPQEMVMYNVQIVDRKGDVSDPKFWFYSYYNFEKQLKNELMDPDNEDFAAFMDLEGGFDLKVRWAKESFDGNDFFKADMIQFVERDEDIDEDILDQVVDLDNCLVIKEYKDLNNIFLEFDDDEGEDPPPEKEEKKRSSRKSKTADKEESKKSGRRKPPAKKEEKVEENPCPYGYEFGADFDNQRRCTKCKVNDDCGDAYDKANPEPDKKEDKKSGDKSENPCPSGFEFGTDCDKNKEICDDCPKWDDCIDKQDELNA